VSEPEPDLLQFAVEGLRVGEDDSKDRQSYYFMPKEGLFSCTGMGRKVGVTPEFDWFAMHVSTSGNSLYPQAPRPRVKLRSFRQRQRSRYKWAKT